MSEEAKKLEGFMNTGQILRSLQVIENLHSSKKKLSFRVKSPKNNEVTFANKEAIIKELIEVYNIDEVRAREAAEAKNSLESALDYIFKS